MTPLEELHAAHKRLSELSGVAARGPWEVIGERPGDDSPAEALLAGNGWQIGDWLDGADAQLIVTLHRTIDAQLAILAAEMRAREEQLKREAFGWRYFPTGEVSPALQLARSINEQS
ncbi:hypothetical protein [Curtobacterium poinsettiae]|uniref:hypothetical protein n=1 Tax=Curtobacterium poinsettiae TaxID=159612 RepID=UPI00217DA9AE|nr:hypothetical protein [Curtobacterium flaccumfaciens]MCS6578213.1 hypothetical protein [Curtobacterium flaccumfaciens]